MMAVIVTGSRDADARTWRPIIEQAIRERIEEHGYVVVIHGDCRGIDRIAADVADSFLLAGAIPVPANWETHGMAAGPIRNGIMLRLLNYMADLLVCDREVLACHDNLTGSKGTKDMVNKAINANVSTWVHDGQFAPYQLHVPVRDVIVR